MPMVVVPTHGEAVFAEGEGWKEIIPEDAERLGLVFQNNTDSEFRLIFGSGTPTQTHGFVLRQGEHIDGHEMHGYTRMEPQDPPFRGRVAAVVVGQRAAQLDYLTLHLVSQ